MVTAIPKKRIQNRSGSTAIELLEGRRLLTGSPTAQPVEGTPWTFYQPVDAQCEKVTINWGDGSSSTTEQFAGSGDDRQAVATHTYKNAGILTNNSEILMYENRPAPYNISESVLQTTVNAAPLTETNVALKLTAGVSYTVVVGKVHDADPTVNPAELSAQVLISPNDTPSPATTLKNLGHGNFDVIADNMKLQSDDFTLQIDVDNKYGTSTFTVDTVTQTAGANTEEKTDITALKKLLAKAGSFAAGVAKNTLEAAGQFWGGVGDWAGELWSGVTGLQKFLSQTPNQQGQTLSQIATTIQNGTGALITGLTNDPQGTLGTAITNAVTQNVQQFQANPARYLGKTLPNLALLAIPGAGEATAVEETAALAAIKSTEVMAGTVEAGAEATEIGAGVTQATVARQAVQQTEEAIADHEAINAGSESIGSVGSGKIISASADVTKFAQGTSFVNICGYTDTLSADGLNTILNALSDVNGDAWSAATGGAGHWENCADTTSIVASRLNEKFGSGITKFADGVIAPSRAWAPDSTLLGARFNVAPVGSTIQKVEQAVTDGGVGARDAIQFAPKVADGSGHALNMVNLGQDGVWALDGQAQTAYKITSAAWQSVKNKYSSRVLSIPQS